MVPSSLKETREAKRIAKKVAMLQEENQQFKAAGKASSSEPIVVDADGGDADAEMDTSISDKVKILRLQKKQIQQAPDFLLDKMGGARAAAGRK